MTALTTPQRVRDRVGLGVEDLDDAVLEGFIADQQAAVEAAARRTFAPGDEGFELARSVVTDLAAAMALVRLAGGTSGPDYRIGKLDVRRQGQLEGRQRAIEELKEHAAEGLELLKRQARARGFVLINSGEKHGERRAAASRGE